ncbi:hypothetical protein J3E74DRAFT_470052 [Bipolaris maydis]|nr:hypothetical protein J3E74DRAFT_470052 [Bipolaris maydis]
MASINKSSYMTTEYLAQERTQNVMTPGGSRSADLIGVKDADFVAIGLGGTNMLAMLWTIAMGRRAVGVELRGDPFLGVHWNIREDILDGSPFTLAGLFYSQSTMAGVIIPGAIIEGYDKSHHMVGDIHDIEYIDDRWKDGRPHRTVTSVPPPNMPTAPDASKIRTDMREVLDGPSTWAGRSFFYPASSPERLVHLPCGRVQIRIEEVTEVQYHNDLQRIRHQEAISSISASQSSSASQQASTPQNSTTTATKRGSAKSPWVTKKTLASPGSSSKSLSTCQLCPAARGLYFAAYQLLLYDYYISQASLILEISPDELRRVAMVYGPKPFSLVERIGNDARVATNGVVAGDSFGNGHFLHSAGAMCGMLGHAYRFLEYWQRRAHDAHCPESSIRLLVDRIKADTEALLQVAAASGIAQDKRAKVAAKRCMRWAQAPLNPTDWRRLFLRNGSTWSAKLPRIDERHPKARMERARL